MLQTGPCGASRDMCRCTLCALLGLAAWRASCTWRQKRAWCWRAVVNNSALDGIALQTGSCEITLIFWKNFMGDLHWSPPQQCCSSVLSLQKTLTAIERGKSDVGSDQTFKLAWEQGLRAH